MKMRKILALLLAALLFCLCLTSCGSKPEASAEAASAESAVPAANTAAADEPSLGTPSEAPATPAIPADPAPADLAIGETAPAAEAAAPALPATRAEALAALTGDWIDFYDRFLDGADTVKTLEGLTEADLSWDGDLPTAVQSLSVYWDEGVPLLVSNNPNGSGRVWVRPADYELYRDRHFLAVDMSLDNYADCIGELIRVGGCKDEPDLGGYMFTNALYEQGWVYAGCRGFRLTALYDDPTGEMRYAITEPYLLAVNNDGIRLKTVESVEGTVYFVRNDYVAENRLREGSGDDRMLVLADGVRLNFVNGWFSLVQARYSDFKY